MAWSKRNVLVFQIPDADRFGWFGRFRSSADLVAQPGEFGWRSPYFDFFSLRARVRARLKKLSLAPPLMEELPGNQIEHKLFGFFANQLHRHFVEAMTFIIEYYLVS